MKEKYLDIDTSNWPQYLLSSDQVKTNVWALRNAEAELEPLMSRFELFSKYKDRVWFQKTMQMTKPEIDFEMFRLGKIITHIEESINDYKTELHWNMVAREELQHSMKPFDGLDLTKIELVQQSLF